MIGPLCDALVDCAHESCGDIDDAMASARYDRMVGHDLPLEQRAALARSYKVNGIVRRELTLEQFRKLEHQIRDIYG